MVVTADPIGSRFVFEPATTGYYELLTDNWSKLAKIMNVCGGKTEQKQSATLATSLKPESSRNYIRLVKARASLARQSEPPPMLSP